MPKYLFTGSYSVEGQKGLLREGGSARVLAVDAIARRVGGKLLSYHFALGDHDFYVITELPDNSAAAAVAATIGASGAVDDFETVTLLSPEDLDAAVKLSPVYRPPGR